MGHIISKMAVLLLAVCVFFSCSRSNTAPKVRSEFLLGTLCSISLHDRGSASILEGAFNIVREIDSKMGLTWDGSEVNMINAASGSSAVGISSETFAVIKRGVAFTELSGGSFDVTVGPLVALWGIGTKDAHVPGQGEIQKALKLIGAENVAFQEDGHKVFLKKPGMKLDLGGIAKGYAADTVVDYLKAKGVTRAIIDFGGNVFVLGSREGDQPWRVGIQNPEKERGAYIGVITVSDKAVVTSGKYERFFEANGVRYHHIFDTTTGYPVENRISSVTIIADDSVTADAMSTAVFAAGLADGLKMVDENVGIEAVLVTEDDRVYLSFEPNGLFKITNPEYRLAENPPSDISKD